MLRPPSGWCAAGWLSVTLNRPNSNEDESYPARCLRLPACCWPPVAPRQVRRSRRRCACRLRWIIFPRCAKATASPSPGRRPRKPPITNRFIGPPPPASAGCSTNIPSMPAASRSRRSRAVNWLSVAPGGRRPLVAFEDVLPPALIAAAESGNLRDRGGEPARPLRRTFEPASHAAAARRAAARGLPRHAGRARAAAGVGCASPAPRLLPASPTVCASIGEPAARQEFALVSRAALPAWGRRGSRP